jgi:hypothetical protein
MPPSPFHSTFKTLPGCIGGSDYFNSNDVQASIHVRKPVEVNLVCAGGGGKKGGLTAGNVDGFPGQRQRWSVCGTAPGWTYTSTRPNLPRDTYPFLIENIKVIPERLLGGGRVSLTLKFCSAVGERNALSRLISGRCLQRRLGHLCAIHGQ